MTQIFRQWIVATQIPWIFPIYLFIVPRSVTELKKACVYLSIFYSWVSLFLIVAQKMKTFHAPAFSLLLWSLTTMFVCSVVTLFVIIKLGRVDRLGLLGLTVSTYVTVPADVWNIYSQSDGIGTLISLPLLVFYLVITSRFLYRVRQLIRVQDKTVTH